MKKEIDYVVEKLNCGIHTHILDKNLEKKENPNMRMDIELKISLKKYKEISAAELDFGFNELMFILKEDFERSRDEIIEYMNTQIAVSNFEKKRNL